MAARDDSVIRGTLITSLIVLVLSLALNFFLYRWGSTSSIEAERAKEQLASSQNELRTNNDRISLMKAMMGIGTISEAEFDVLRQSASGDPEMEAIERRFLEDMAYLGPDVDPQNRNYPALPEYLVNAIRSRNDQYGQARDEASTIRSQAASDVDNARKAEEEAKKNRDAAIQKQQQDNEEFLQARAKMKEDEEKNRDEMTKASLALAAVRKQAADEKAKLEGDLNKNKAIVETQRQELNRLRSDRFENVQGEISYVVPPGRMVHINLGSADSLVVGVQFGVVDVNELNVEEAELKSQIQVIKILGEHSAQARVLGNPSYKNPLVRGDKLYSPFWAPGRKVRIALAGDIDITGDGRSNTEQLKAMIERAGAEVAATISSTGVREGKLDSSVRFLVIGEQPDSSAEPDADAKRSRAMDEISRLKAEATELGITTIPAWKLLEYLKGISDSVTTPLGAGARGTDFAPLPATGMSGRNQSNLLPEIYRNQIEGQPQQPRR
jgi:flagellar biosynthesis GTPase FlhF